MTALTDLEQASENIARLIKKITENPKPDYEIDGQSVKWGDYLDTLIKSKSKVDALIAKEEPFEEHTQVFTPDAPRY